MTYTFSLFKGPITNKNPEQDPVELSEILEKFRSGFWYDEGLRKVRTLSDKKERQAAKRKLPYVCFSGTFHHRAADKLIQHSGLLVLDFDDIDGLSETRLQLAQDPHCLALFTSTSGNGLKMLIRIEPAIEGTDADKVNDVARERHLRSFQALEAYMKEHYNLVADASGKDVSRACYVTADSKLFHNPDALVFPIVGETVGPGGEVIKVAPRPVPFQHVQINPMEQLEIVAQRIVDEGIDLTDTYERWQLCAFACASQGESGREVFHLLSSRHPDYNRKLADDKFDNAHKTGKFRNPGWIFRQAVDRGVDVVVRGPRSTQRQSKDSGRQSKRRDEKEGHLSISEETAHRFSWPRGCKGSDEMKRHVLDYSFIEHANRIWYATFKDDDEGEGEETKKKITFRAITNYIIRPLFLVTSSTAPIRLVEIENIHGSKKVLDIPTKAFSSVTEFNALVEAVGNFHSSDMSKAQFSKVKAKLYDETEEALEVQTLGWHKAGFLAFANGAVTMKEGFKRVDKHGMVEVEGQYYYLPATSSTYKDEDSQYEMEKKMAYEERDITFQEWAEHFVRVNGENSKVALAYYVASTFRDIIYSFYRFFPHLFLFGIPGTGKNNTGNGIYSLYGRDLKPFNLVTGTNVGFHRTFAQFRNGIAWFDEYDNSLVNPQRIAQLKAAYDGAGHVKGEFTAGQSAGSRLTSTPVLSACIISGQQMPTRDNALMKRVILCEYSKTDRSEDEKVDNDRLRRIQEAGLTHLTGQVVRHREKVETRFHTNMAEISKRLQRRAPETESRQIENYSIILAVVKSLENDLAWPFKYDELEKAMFERMVKHQRLIVGAKETSDFWQTVDFLAMSKEIKREEDFDVVSRTALTAKINGEDRPYSWPAPHPVVLIRLTRVHPKYLEARRKQGLAQGMDRSSLLHYLEHSKEYLGLVRSVRIGQDNNTSAYAFDAHALLEAGYDFAHLANAPNGEEPPRNTPPDPLALPSEPGRSIPPIDPHTGAPF